MRGHQPARPASPWALPAGAKAPARHAARARPAHAGPSRQAYPPARGRPGGRWSSACTSSTGRCRAGRQARLTAICWWRVFPGTGQGRGAAVTGARAWQTETPCPRARAIAELRSCPHLAQLESRPRPQPSLPLPQRDACAGTNPPHSAVAVGCAVPAFLSAGTVHPAATAYRRSASAARPAVRMRSRGAGEPVISSNWPAAWCRRRSKPSATAAPAWRAALVRGVGQGW